VRGSVAACRVFALDRLCELRGSGGELVVGAGDIEHVLSGRCGVQLLDGFIEALPETIGSTASGSGLQLIRRPGVGGTVGWPVKARGVRGPADTRLLACGLGETGQAGVEAVIGRRHPVRLKRITPAIERIPEVAEHHPSSLVLLVVFIWSS
jgi:hypothetical protein